MTQKSARPVLPLFAAIFIDLFSFGLMYPVIVSLFDSPAVLAAYSDTARAIYFALACSLFPLGMFLGSPWLADLSDSLGRKRTLLLCMAGLAGAYALMWLGVATLDLAWLLLGRFCSGLMAGTSPIAQAALVEEGKADDAGGSLSRAALVNSLALVCGPAAGGLLAHVGFGAPLGFSILLCLGALLWLQQSYREPARPRRPANLGWKRPFQIFADATRHPRVSRIALSFLLFQFGYGLYYIYIMVRMTVDYGVSTAALGLFSGLIGVGYVVSSFLGYRLAIRLLGDDRRAALAASLVCGGIIALSALPVPEWVQWALAFGAALANLPIYVGLLALLSGAVDEAEQGWALGVGSSMVALGFFLAGLLGLLVTTLPLSLLLLAGGLLVIAGALPLLRLRASPAPA